MNDAPQTPGTTCRFRAGGISLSVTGYGAGPTLVLLHGIGSRGVSWWPVVDDLAPWFRLIVPDLRGHGASDRPAAGYLLPDYAADLAGLVDALGLERPLVMGHSLGGMVALHWATRHPTRAAAIVIEDAPLRAAEDVAGLFNGWIALASATVAEATAHFRRQHPSWTDDECERRAVSITSTAVAVFEELRDQNLNDTGANRIAPLAAIQSPTLFVHGDLATGGMVDQRDAVQFGRTAPNARVVRIAGGSHSLHRDQPVAFLTAVLPFLREHAPRS